MKVFPGYALSGSDQMIRRLGGDPLAIAAAAGVPETAFTDPSIPINADACLRFTELAAEVCHCDTFGLQLGAQVDMTFLGPVWVLMQDAQTPKELLQDLQRHLVLYSRAINMGLRPTGDGLECTVEIVGDAVENDRQAIEYCLCQVISYLKRRLGGSWNSPRVQFRHSPPRSLRIHHQHFGPNVFFNAESTGFLVDTQTLNRPLANAHRAHSLIAASLKPDLPHDWELFANKVEGMVLVMMPFSFPTQERVAKELMLSPRTLQRYLFESGTTFNEIRDKVRAKLAAKYLRQSSLTIVQISELLGYSQSSAFCRSFSRWYGTSPLSYQKNQKSRALAKDI